MAIATRPLSVGLSANLSVQRADWAAKKRNHRRHSGTLSFSSSLLRPSQGQAEISKNSCRALKSGNAAIKRNRSGSAKHPGEGPAGLSGFSEGRDEDAGRLVCPGCGVFMQDRRPDASGFFVRPERESEPETLDFLEDVQQEEEEEEEEADEEEEEEEEEEADEEEEEEDGIDWDWKPPVIVDEEEEWRKGLDGFALAGPGYGNVTEENIAKKKRKNEKPEEPQTGKEVLVVCARCHSLRHYGHVKDQAAERLLPDFDFDRIVGSRVRKPAGGNRPVVVMVVDAVDFEGSFPRRAVRSLLESTTASMEGKSRNGPLLVLVATKIDLLPQQISPARLDKWVRQRARSGGAPKLSGVFLVSAHKDLGVRNLAGCLKQLAGPRGNAWVIGAQNAGKSTLINAIVKRERGKVSQLTEAPFPGTTLGVLRIGGILPAKAKLYDTPGLLHPYQLFTRLNREEQKMVQIRKEVKPRTYRMKVGQAVHVGGLMRLDVNEASIETIYVTVWSSVHLPLHLGKAENANEIKEKHFGVRLQPPIGTERVSELGEWKWREIKVSGNSWDINATDVAIAGIGWFSVCLKGEATLSVWTYDGVDVTVREALVLDRARFLERPGFSLSKVVSEAISNKAKLKSNDLDESTESKEKKHDDSRMFAEVIH